MQAFEPNGSPNEMQCETKLARFAKNEQMIGGYFGLTIRKKYKKFNFYEKGILLEFWEVYRIHNA